MKAVHWVRRQICNYLTLFEETAIFEHLYFSLLFCPWPWVGCFILPEGWREAEWLYPEWAATLFSEYSAVLSSVYHEVTLHVILVQIQLYQFNRRRTYKRCPFAPWGSMYALLQRFFKTQSKMKPKRINSWLLCFWGHKCKKFIDELRFFRGHFIWD